MAKKRKTGDMSTRNRIARIIRAKLNFGHPLTPAERSFLNANPTLFGRRQSSSSSQEDKIIYEGGSRSSERAASTKRALERSLAMPGRGIGFGNIVGPFILP